MSNFFKEQWRLFIASLKSDWATIKCLLEGKYKSKYSLKEWLDPRDLIKELFSNHTLLLILAFTVGYFIAAKRYEAYAHQYIIDTCMNFAIENPGQAMTESFLNATKHLNLSTLK